MTVLAFPKPVRDQDPRFRAWIRETQRCVVCGAVCPDPHHVVSRGAGGGDRANLVPLCRRHHDEHDRLGQHSFQRKYRLHLPRLALVIWVSYRFETDQREVF